MESKAAAGHKRAKFKIKSQVDVLHRLLYADGILTF